MHASTQAMRFNEHARFELNNQGNICQDCLEVHGRYYVCEPLLARYAAGRGDDGQSWPSDELLARYSSTRSEPLLVRYSTTKGIAA